MPQGRTLAVALVGIVAACGLTACSSEPPPKPQTKIDHTTNATPVQQSEESGPPARALQANWRIDLKGATNVEGDTGFEHIDGQLMLATESGITAYDGRTGAERWHYREPGRTTSGYAVPGKAQPDSTTNPALVVFTERRGTPRRIVGLDSATGRLLWKASPTWQPVINPKTRKAVAAGGVVMGVDQTPEGATIVGVDGWTGNVRWTQRRLQYCDPVNLQGVSNTDGSVFVLPEGCFYTVSELHAFDPATGAELWRRRPPPEFTDVMVRGGVTLLNSRSVRRPFSVLINREGKRLKATPPPCAYGIGCHFTADSERVFLSAAKGAEQPKLIAIEPRRRTVKELTLPGGPADEHTVLSGGSGRVYAMRKRLAGRLLPAELDLIDPKKLKVQRVAMPFGFQDGGVGEYWKIGRVEAGDGLLYVLGDIGGKIRVTAYAPSGDKGPAALGGTAVKDWPDACKLVEGIDELRLKKVDEFGVDAVRLGDWGCRLSWTEKLKTTVVVIGWVAPDDKQAAAMMVVDPAQAHPLADVGDQAYTFENIDQGGPDLVLRIGRHIVTSYGIREQEREDLVNLARTIVRNIQQEP